MEPIRLDPLAHQAMYDLAQRDPRHEACAFLEGRGRFVQRIHPTPNVHEEPATRYAVDPAAFLALEDDLEDGATQVVGVFHTHPASPGVPSATDRAHAQPGWFYLILGFPGTEPEGELRGWELAAADAHAAFVETPVVLAEVAA